MENLHVDSPIYPLFSLLGSIVIFIIGIIISRDIAIVYFLIVLTIIYFIFDYAKALFKIIPIFILIGALIGLGAFISSRDLLIGIQTAGRIILLAYSSILMIGLPPINLTRNLVQLNFPRILTLGMLATIRFVPVLINESMQIKEAMKTRGVKFSWFNISCIYRAFFVPLIMRVLNMADILAISVETRGFVLSKKQTTVYKEIHLSKQDILFAIALLFCIIGVMVLWIN